MIFSVGISKTLEHTPDIPGIDHSFYGEHIHVVPPFKIRVALAPRQGRALKRKTFWPTLLKRFTMFAQKSNKNTEAWGHLTTNVILCPGEWHNFPTIQDLFHNSRFAD
jgi:hypothetical protein